MANKIDQICKGFSLTRDAVDASLPGSGLGSLFPSLLNHFNNNREAATYWLNGSVFSGDAYVGCTLVTVFMVLSLWVILSCACCCNCFNGRRKIGRSQNACWPLVITLLFLLLLFVAGGLWQFYNVTGTVKQSIKNGVCTMNTVPQELLEGWQEDKEQEGEGFSGLIPLSKTASTELEKAAQVVEDASQPLHNIWLTVVQDVVQHGKEDLSSRLENIEILNGVTIGQLHVSDDINEAIDQADLLHQLDHDTYDASMTVNFKDLLLSAQQFFSNSPSLDADMKQSIERFTGFIFGEETTLELAEFWFIVCFGSMWLAFSVVYTYLKVTAEGSPGRICAGCCMQGCFCNAFLCSILLIVIMVVGSFIGAVCTLSSNDLPFQIQLASEVLDGTSSAEDVGQYSAGHGELFAAPLKLAKELDKTCLAREGTGRWAESIFGTDRDWMSLSKCILNVPYEHLKEPSEPHWTFLFLQHILLCLHATPWTAEPDEQVQSRRLAVADWAPPLDSVAAEHVHDWVTRLFGKNISESEPPAKKFEAQLEAFLTTILEQVRPQLVSTGRLVVESKARDNGLSYVPGFENIINHVEDEVELAISQALDGLLPDLKTHIPKALESLEDLVSQTFGQLFQMADESVVPMTNCKVLGHWRDSIRKPICSTRGLGGSVSALIWLCALQTLSCLVAAVLFFEVATTKQRTVTLRPHEPWGYEMRRVT